jgi:small subunit ribosomal protein S8
MTDTIAEMLTQIRNAQMAGHENVTVRFSNLKMAIAIILEQEGFVSFSQKEKRGKFETIKIGLKYYMEPGNVRVGTIKGLEKISKLGKRVYVTKKDDTVVRNNFGISIISTSKGVMTGREAKKQGLGGEYICKVW